MSKRGTSASGYQASREKYKCPVKECQKSELRGDDILLGQVSGITSIPEVEQSIFFLVRASLSAQLEPFLGL